MTSVAANSDAVFVDRGRLQRSTLFVPAASWRMLEKAAASEADAVCIDLEDSVPAAEKVGSRANAVRALQELDFGGRTRIVRINGINSPWAYHDLREVIIGAGARLHSVMLPKVAAPLDVHFVATLLSQFESQVGVRRPVAIEVQIENAAGFVNVHHIARSSQRLVSVIFGQGDYSASMHMPATGIGTVDANDELYPGHRYHAVSHAIVAAARAAGLRCIDGPYSAYGDAAGLERSCQMARVLGFDGKQCIHPAQLAEVNRSFSPSEAEVAHAHRVVDAYAAGVAQGLGAVSLDGKMIDEANARMASVVLDKLRRVSRVGSN
jgi:citrate lyase subunit beta/citryl-CoA lyase